MKISGVLVAFVVFGQFPCQAQEAQDYMKRIGNPQANYYNIVAEVDSALKAAPTDTSEESAGVLFARWKWFWSSRMGDAMDGAKTGKFSHYVDVMKSLVQTKPCTSPSSYPASWGLLGPVQLERQEMGWINAVARDPNNASVVYAGAPNGGLWRTNDIDAADPVWQNITDQSHLPGLGIGDILIDPSNSDIIYIATGFYTGNVGFGVGVLKTSNGMDPLPTWDFTGVNYNPFVNEITAVKKLVMSPVDHNTIYAFTGKEVFKTTDGGDTWPSMGLNAAIANDALDIANLVIDPLDPGNIVVTTTRFDDNDDLFKGGLWRWVNSTSTWSQLTENLSASLFHHPHNRYPVYLAATNSMLYALYRTSVDSRIDQSTDGGITWFLHTVTNNYGPLFIVSDENTNIMYTADGKNDGESIGRKVYKSTNGGTSFFKITEYNGTYNGTSTHADIRALQLFQASSDGLNDILLAGTDGGVLYSTSTDPPPNNKVHWRNVNGSGLAVGQFYGLAGSEKVPERIVAGAQDNGFSTHENGRWINLIVGDAYRMAIDRENPLNAIGEKIGWGLPSTLNGGNYLGKTNDGGQTWNVSQPQPPWGNSGNSDNFNMGLQISPDIWNVRDQPLVIDHENNMYIGFHDLFRYNPSSNSWTPLSDFTAQGVGAGSGCSAFAISPSDPDVIYFGFENPTWDVDNLIKKKIWKTLDGGASWADITNDLPVNWYAISGIVVDPAHVDRVWVSFGAVGSYGNLAEPYNGSSRVYYTSDGGATWTDYSLGLTPLPINTIVYETGSTDGLYVGTDVGVFYTNRSLYNSDNITDPQNTGWVCFNDEFPACIVTGLEINYASNKLRASTYGRGIWESSLACPLNTDLYFTTANAAGLSSTFQEASNNVSIVADAGTSVFPILPEERVMQSMFRPTGIRVFTWFLGRIFSFIPVMGRTTASTPKWRSPQQVAG